MAQYITTAFAGGNDIALQLGNEEWVRTLAIGSTWTHVRIGLLYQITGTATTAGGTGFAVGMCSGSTAPFNGASTTNFVGIECVTALGFVANSGNPYYQFASGNLFACKKVVATITTAATNLGDSVDMGVPTAAGSTLRRGLLYVDITKGSPNYTIGISAASGMGSTSSGSHDFTVAELLSGMTQPFGSMTVGGFLLSNGNGAQALACDETAGGFDTVDIYSNELNNPFNLYEVAVEKLA